MKKKKIVVVGCSSKKGQSICKKLATSERVDLVAGFDTMFSTALNYPFKTYATVDELKVSFIVKITEEITAEEITIVLIDMIISTKEVPKEVYSFASEYNIPIVAIKDENEITEALEEYL